MYPILIKLGPITIHTYGFLLAVGVLCGILLTLKLSKEAGLDTKIVSDFLFFTILIGLIGAKLWLFFTEFNYYMNDPSTIPSLLTSAGTFYGGLLFGLLFVIWFVRKHKLNFKLIGDTMTPSVALAHFFGRMGCFAAGCCWGRHADGCSVAVQFNSPDTTTGVPHYTPLYPTQLIEAILNLFNFIFLFIVFKKRKFDGQVFALYFMNYSIIRFCVEFFRGDDDRGYVIGSMQHPFTSISIPQLVSILGFIAAIVVYKKFKKSQLKTNS